MSPKFGMIWLCASMALGCATMAEAKEWREVQPGVWQATIGKHDKPTLTEAAGAKPRSPMTALPRQALPFSLQEVKLESSRDGSAVQLPLAKGERIFGLGMQMSGCDRRGGIYHLRVDHYESGHDRLHAPTPMYISSRGYAVFFNTSRPIDVYVGVGNRLDDPNLPKIRDRNTDKAWDAQPDSSKVEASVQGAGLEILVFEGPTPMDALRRYNLFCGGGAMPPMWALGFWHRMRSLASADEVLNEVGEFEKRGFPLDVLGLEPGWQTQSYPGSMEWDPERFGDPANFISRLRASGIEVNLWENPYVAKGTEYFKKLDRRFGSHTVWLGAVPDIYDPKAAKIARDFHQKRVNEGVGGYKIDEVDGFDVWLWPDHARFPSGLGGLQMRQIYGVLWQRELDRLFRENGQRTFGLVRGSNGAATRFPFAIYSDTYNHRQYVTALTNSSTAGVLWCAEIRSADSPEEWVRRMQSACLAPIAQLNAWDSGKKPWSFPSVEATIRETMRLRESLVPYLYTAFAQYAFDGIPPVRPMCLVDGGLETDQYFLGDDLLVAPIFTGEKSRKVRLPKGDWFDYQTGRRMGSDETIEIEPKLDQIPLFVRGGAAIPTWDGTLNVAKSMKSDIVLRCYGSGLWRSAYYEDDGRTLAFEKGDFGFFRLESGEGSTSVRRVAGSRTEAARRFSSRRIGG